MSPSQARPADVDDTRRVVAGRWLTAGMLSRSVVALGLAVLATACTGSTPSPDPTAPPVPPKGIEPSVGIEGEVRTTSGDQTGNRVTVGTLDLDVEPWRIDVGAEPRWIVGGPIGDDTAVYVVVAADGTATAVTIEPSGPSTADLGLADPNTPPVVVFGDGEYEVLAAPGSASPVTAPAIVGSSVISVTVEGEVSVTEGDAVERIAVDGLGDSRLAVDERGLVAVLSDPTAEYGHGVLGDRVESATVTVFDPASAEVIGVASAPDGTVFETVSPMWADVDGDGDSELLLTASDDLGGGRLVLYDERGDRLAASASIGRGQRWRNQLGVVSIDGVPTVIDVQTPHIGGIVQWFRLQGDVLEQITSIREYSSHRIGSRNLDQGVIVDGDGDGSPDVVVPSQRQQSLAALELTDGVATEVRSVSLGARLSTNLSAFTKGDGRASLALGLEDGSVLIWP